jgi:hypothetical protein
VNTTDYRSVDKVVGIIVAVYASLGVCCGGAIGLSGGALAAMIGTQGEAIPAVFVGGWAVVIGLFIAATALLNLFGGLAMAKHKRWGFLVCAIMYGLSALGGFSGYAGFLNIIPDLAICVYCALRLSGSLPPKPE